MASISKGSSFEEIVGRKPDYVEKEDRATTGIIPGATETPTQPVETPTPTPEPTQTPAQETPTPEPTEPTPTAPSTDPNAATSKQIAYMDGLGISYNPNITKSEATALLTQAIAELEAEEGGTTTPTTQPTSYEGVDPYTWATANEPATSGQLSYLNGLGIAYEANITKAQASALLATAIEAKTKEKKEATGEQNFVGGTIETTEKELTKGQQRDIIEEHFNLKSKERREVEKVVDLYNEGGMTKDNLIELIEQSVDERQGGLEYMEYLLSDGETNTPPGLEKMVYTETKVTQPSNVAGTKVKRLSGDLKDMSFLEHIAALGLKPAEVIGNQILAGAELFLNGIQGFVSLEEQGNIKKITLGRADVVEMANTWYGQIIGGATAIIGGGLYAAGAGIWGGLVTLYAANQFILEPSELATWAAVDNIAGATAYQINQVSYGVSQGLISQSEAAELLRQAEENVNSAEEYVNQMTALNPKLWATRGILMQSIQTARDTIAVQKSKLGL